MTDDSEHEDIYEDARDDPDAAHPVERLRECIERDGVDLAAVIWMFCVLAVVGAVVWQALRAGSLSDGVTVHVSVWERLYYLAATGNLSVAVALAVGVAIAAALDSAASRFAATLGVVGALWMVAAGGFGIAYAVHAAGGSEVPRLATGPFTVNAFAVAVLGLIIAAAAWRVATSVPDYGDDEDGEGDEYEDLEPVSVS